MNRNKHQQFKNPQEVVGPQPAEARGGQGRPLGQGRGRRGLQRLHHDGGGAQVAPHRRGHGGSHGRSQKWGGRRWCWRCQQFLHVVVGSTGWCQQHVTSSCHASCSIYVAWMKMKTFGCGMWWIKASGNGFMLLCKPNPSTPLWIFMTFK